MEKKFKSANDVFKQMMRIEELYATHDNTKKETPWLRVAVKIGNHYMDEIARHIDLCETEEQLRRWSDPAQKEKDPERIRFAYVIRSFMRDTSREEIARISPFMVEGLYFIDDDGNKITPHSLYFGCDARFWRDDPEHAQPNGYCYCHYLNALRPVMLPNGKRYIRREWANVNCRYANGLLYDFYRE